MDWKVWYDSGRTFRSDETAWADLPAEGFQFAVHYHPSGVARGIGGQDRYWLGETDIEGDSAERDRTTDEQTTTDAELESRILARNPTADLKVGVWQPDGAMREQMLEAQASVNDYHGSATKWR